MKVCVIQHYLCEKRDFIFEICFILFCLGRESLRDTASLQSTSGRYSPVRRASDGCSPVSHVRSQLDRMYYQTLSGHQTSPDSFKAVLQEYQQLQVIHCVNL